MNIGGQAAEASGINAKMIRYYESIGLVSQASRTEAGYRQQNERDIQALHIIKRSRALGFSIERIRTLLGRQDDRGRSSEVIKKLARQYFEELDQAIQKLQCIRDHLQHLAANCRGEHWPDCPILNDLALDHRPHQSRSQHKISHLVPLKEY